MTKVLIISVRRWNEFFRRLKSSIVVLSSEQMVKKVFLLRLIIEALQ
jgi:hypothetical protein